MPSSQMLNSDEWEYKCEGLGNVILSHVDQQHHTTSKLRGKVLRVRKCPRELLLISQSSPNSHKTYEEELNSTYSRLKGVSSREEYLKIYVKDVIGKLLDVCHEKGQELVDPGETVPVSREFLQEIKEKINPLRSEQMLNYKLDFDIFADSAILMRDFTFNRNHHLDPTLENNSSHHDHHNQTPDYTFCVEIKPKWGMICSSEFISPHNKPIKYETCRYCMQQFTKLKQGLILNTSSFCPTNLFSSREERVKKGLFDLIDNPQNNMRLYIDGKLVWFDDNSVTVPNRNFREELCQLLKKHQVENLEKFVHYVSYCLIHSNIMETLQRLHQLDRFDIEFIYPHVYSVLKNKYGSDEKIQELLFNFNSDMDRWMDLLKQELTREEKGPCCQEFECSCSGFSSNSNGQKSREEEHSIYSRVKPHLRTFEDLVEACRSEDEEFCWHVLRMYLTAHCVKDCSVMISFNLSHVERDGVNGDGNHDDGMVEYDIGLVDLDPKIAAKIPSYYEMDQEIIKLYVKEKGLVTTDRQ
ncbi:hypothetical protein FDP41_002152 [Naegleria fowleri]|uniref:Inositol-pentakisphosphate 2-kinase n=1 Tax=Naegleria fowleri TaxID=5763 RepID=A0A6A5BWR4_NAEFO|nr:uncharacterized protein FDP41_002152 [Naegleria fowleri]KAF0979082.1 hypothetical protein FDP41_002152 [Naegleria fowleri]